MAIYDAKHLSSMPILRRLTAEELERLAEAIYVRPLVEGEVLAEANETGRDAFIVRDGEVVIDLPARASRPVARLRPGNVVGEVCLIEPGPRLLRIRATTAGSVYVIDGERFRALCDAGDTGAHKVVQAVSHTLALRLRDATRRLQDGLRPDEDAPVDAPADAPAPSTWTRLKRLFGGLG